MSSGDPSYVRPPRLVLFAMRCAFSEQFLAGLIAAGVDVRAVVLPAPGSALPLTLHWRPEPARWLPLVGGGIAGMAAAAGIPIAEIPEPSHRKVLGWLSAREPDLFVVACFPRRLPRALRQLAPSGAVNVHPSLLPAGRGPDPLFWTFLRGERQTGTTLHLLDDGFDTGPIVAQESVAVPDGIREPELETMLARLGSRLLTGAIPALLAGSVVAAAQDEQRATAAPLPTTADFEMPTDLPARWAFNFARGVAPRRGPLRVLVLANGARLDVTDALDWSADERLPRPVIIVNESARIQFLPGTVRFRLGSPDRTNAPA